MFGMIMPLCNRMFCCIFGWYFYIEISLKYEKLILLSSSRTFSLSIPYMENSTVLSDLELFHCPPLWTKVRLHGKKTTKCNKVLCKYVEHMVRSIGEKFENCPFLPRRWREGKYHKFILQLHKLFPERVQIYCP